MRIKASVLMAASLVVAHCLWPLAAHAQSTEATPNVGPPPDPATVIRAGAGYKYPQAGWWVVHIEGTPYERGTQHGRLMAEEIAADLRCLAMTYSSSAPDDALRMVRVVVNSLFLRQFDPEYLEEMKGIADGAAAAGAKYGDRPIDLTDIAALNVWAELSCLDGALDALPTGLEGIRFPQDAGKPPRPTAEGHCSAFAATGPATADGHAVIGHITMFGLYESNFFNVWLDIKPEKGHRIVMQSFPGGIQSSMDYYQNDAGLVLVETTIDQTRFDKDGLSLASRIRRAVQYGETIDDAVRMLSDRGNGLYTNEWLLADMKTDEIAMFELGTHTSKLYRSGVSGMGAARGEWFGGTEGFYWGCNNTKDLRVRLEGVASLSDTPRNVVWHPADRDVAWVKLYNANKGKIDERFARTAFTTRPICGSPSLDAKFTTRDLAKHLSAWALFGPPRGMTWEPTFDEQKKYPEVRPLVSNPWTILRPDAPPSGESAAVDLQPLWTAPNSKADSQDSDSAAPRQSAWRGTILAKSDADIWLAAAFAEYQSLVAEEQGMAATRADKCLCDTDHDKAAASLQDARSRYLESARSSGDIPLSQIKRRFDSSDWYDIAAGKGELVLSELRLRMGDDAFADLMDKFGREHAGEEVATADFTVAAAKAAGEDLSMFFSYWLNQPGMPTLRIEEATCRGGAEGSPTELRGVLAAKGGPLPTAAEATAEWAGGETTRVVRIDPQTGEFSLMCDHAPVRLVVDKYCRSARADGGAASVGSYTREIERSLIIYGTADDEAGNRDAATRLQKQLQQNWFNCLVPVKSDREVSDSELADDSLVLIGRPSANRVTARVAESLPLSFGPRSFTVRYTTYAHPLTAVLAAAASPFNPAHDITVIAGNDAESTVRAVERSRQIREGAEVVVLLRDGTAKPLTVPPPQLVWNLDTPSGGGSR